jgi:hypothetical protein
MTANSGDRSGGKKSGKTDFFFIENCLALIQQWVPV